MSKRSKSAAKDKRKSLKRGRKAAMNLQYSTWAAAGQNGSKRSKLRNKRNMKKSLNVSSHMEGPCGNQGCRKCAPFDYNLLTPRLFADKLRRDAERGKPIRKRVAFKVVDERPTLLGANFLS